METQEEIVEEVDNLVVPVRFRPISKLLNTVSRLHAVGELSDKELSLINEFCELMVKKFWREYSG